ncbi:hypothetical protein BDY21DRAFT_356518 [Lineolata rhizophorae]|uniref:C2H2-type domain-containing protein n=1 Tax=Lineolata rhizophorae TaxID=578093 RepID=A0A6A6NPP4_9PEZI|nr:hypothetical protein BDY21DRAFT_356518 [Lineolata rhizophorae]
MPPRAHTNPPPKTESAREALKSFYCDICNKGYARQNEFSAHELSYEHNHNMRRKELRNMTRDPRAAEKARRAERREAEKNGIFKLSVEPDKKTGSDAGSKSGFVKSGFKPAFAPKTDGRESKPTTTGFKPAFTPKPEEGDGKPVAGFKPAFKPVTLPKEAEDQAIGRKSERVDADSDDYSDDDSLPIWGDYDPHKPLDCFPECPGRKFTTHDL